MISVAGGGIVAEGLRADGGLKILDDFGWKAVRISGNGFSSTTPIISQ